MKSAYLYVRVSTDAQKGKGYSLVKQEDRLIRHCELNGIQVKGVYREDYSAEDFNRHEWKNSLRNSGKTPIGRLKISYSYMGLIQQEH